MKKLIVCLLFSAFFSSVNSGYGNENPSSQLKLENEKWPHRLYLGPEIFLFDLNTHVKNIKIDGLKCFEGLRFRYEYLKPKRVYAGVDFLSAVSYKSFNASSQGYHFHQNNGVTGFGNFELRLGYTFAYKNGMLTPFLGMGAYAFKTNGHYFHFRESMVYYAAGMRCLFELSRIFSIGLNWKAFRTDATEQRFKYVLMGQTITDKDYNDMWGGEIGVPLIWNIGATKRWNIQVEPYFLKLDFSEVQNIYGSRFLFGCRL